MGVTTGGTNTGGANNSSTSNNGGVIAAASAAATAGIASTWYAIHKANAAKNEQTRIQTSLETLESNRQQIINPFENVANQYANLGVATQAAEFQAEQTDIALANTLDAVRQTGAGGATALAQAALQSKKGISASLEQQELANEQLRAKGAMEVQKLKAAGEQFVFEQQEERELQKLDRLQAQIDQERQTQADMMAAGISSLGSMVSSAGSIAGALSDPNS
tara:strand:- start:510 stop:1172 length:663 start_codon:yes stop_codon:yes gene_type:complete